MFDIVADSSDNRAALAVVTVMGLVIRQDFAVDCARHAQRRVRRGRRHHQHIGAYQVTSPESGKKITFIERTGHASIHRERAERRQAAKVTDIGFSWSRRTTA